MRKNNPGMMDEQKQPRRKLPAVVTIVLGLLISPLVYEGSLICAAQWKSMYGMAESPKTPVLDFIADTASQMRRETGEVLTPIFRTVPWKPAVVVPIAILWTGVSVLLLRR